MPSVRLRHPSFRNLTFAVVHHRPYREPLFCASCGLVHTHKTYHLHLDAQGEVVVSEVIFERLSELEGLPLRKVGIERNPQPMTLTVPPAGVNGVVQVPTQIFVPKDLREVS